MAIILASGNWLEKNLLAVPIFAPASKIVLGLSIGINTLYSSLIIFMSKTHESEVAPLKKKIFL
jgi:hypothetical protein